MWLVVLGVVLLVLKAAGVVAGLSWWLVLAPFALAAVWWQIADATGYTQRQAMERERRRAEARRQAQFEALGMRAPPAGRVVKPPPSEDRTRPGD